MAESTLRKVSRLIGGLVLTQGKLGHQVLGQLLIADSTEVEVAGAAVLVAATTHSRDAVTQVVMRTAAPAIAVHLLARREEKRLQRLLARTGVRADPFAAPRARGAVRDRVVAAAAPAELASLRIDNERLRGELDALAQAGCRPPPRDRDEEC